MRSSPRPVWKGEMPYTLIVNEKGEVVYRELGALASSRCAAPSCPSSIASSPGVA